MKLMNKIKNNFLGFIIGGIVFGGISYGVASQILATQVSYTNTKSVANVTNVDGALTELYGLAEECQNASSVSGIEYKGKNAVAIYLDPTNLSTTCTSADSSNTGTINGCMRFYIYAEDVEYKYAILDHNTTAKVSSCSGNCFAKAQSQVKQDTASWDPNLQARNISAIEVYKITESTNNATNWQINEGSSFVFNSSSNNGEGYGWLFDRTYGCRGYGCTTEDDNTDGYWTSDVRDSSNAWRVRYTSELSKAGFGSSLNGVRPVIQIAK